VSVARPATTLARAGDVDLAEATARLTPGDGVRARVHRRGRDHPGVLLGHQVADAYQAALEERPGPGRLFRGVQLDVFTEIGDR